MVGTNLDLGVIMSSRRSWRERKKQLWDMLDLENPEDGDERTCGRRSFSALQDKGEPDIGSPYEVGLTRTSLIERMSEFNEIRFTNRDLSNFGALAHGPFGSVGNVRNSAVQID